MLGKRSRTWTMWVAAPSTPSWPPCGVSYFGTKISPNCIAQTMADSVPGGQLAAYDKVRTGRGRISISGGRWRWGLRWRTGPHPPPSDPPRRCGPSFSGLQRRTQDGWRIPAEDTHGRRHSPGGQGLAQLDGTRAWPSAWSFTFSRIDASRLTAKP